MEGRGWLKASLPIVERRTQGWAIRAIGARTPEWAPGSA